MKKVLSLLLVLTMIFSFTGVMGSAALADEDAAEAVVEEIAPAPAESAPAAEEFVIVSAPTILTELTVEADANDGETDAADTAVPEAGETDAIVPEEGEADTVVPEEGEIDAIVPEEGDADAIVSEEDESAELLDEAIEDAPTLAEDAPAAGGLTVGSTYALFFAETTYLLNDDGTLKTESASSSYSTGNPRGAITPAAGTSGGYAFTMAGASSGTTYVGVVGGAIAAVAAQPAGDWFYSGGVLSYVEGDTTLYVTGDGLAMGAAQGAGVQMVAITASSGGGGGGGGGSNNVYANAVTNASVPNLVYVDAPHWINLSNSGHETTKTVSLSARFPDGVESDAMTFRWSFGEETFTETIPASKAVDGVFTSTFTVSVEGLEAGVYPVSCAVSYKIGDDEILVTQPESSDTASEGEAWSYTLGSNTKMLIVTDVRGKPTVTIDGTEITTEEDMSASPPASYIPADTLEALTAGTHTVVIDGDGGPEEHELTIVDPNASAGVSSLTVGASYAISFEANGETYAVGLDGSAVIAVTPDKAAVWECEEGTNSKGESVTFLKSGDYYLNHNGSILTTSSSGSSVTYNGTLEVSAKGSKRQISGVSDSSVAVAKSGIEVSLTAAATDKKITVGEAYTYTLGINKDLVIPTDDNGPHTVTIKGAETEFTENAEAATITIASSIIEALSTGSYTIAVTDKDDAVVNHKLTVQNPPQIDVNVNVIIANGVKENSFITFSDVHETWDDVGTAVYDTILATNGLIPALIIATGDFNNNRVAGNDEAYITGCVNEIINRVSLQLAGIDTVWVSGNHDNGFATQYTNYNLQADLGIVLDDYASGPVSGSVVSGLTGTGTISGTGIIFDTRSDGYTRNADSSQYADGLIVIGLNYEDGDSFSKNDYGTGEEEGDSVYKHIRTALDSVAANYNGELVVISSHAGLHNLAADEDGSTTSNDNGYSISNSAAIVKLVNSYVDKYGMDIIWLFGHDHSRGEEEMVKLPGATITSTNTFGAEENETEDIELKFTYAHAGYVGKGAAGINNRNYTYLTWNDTAIIRKEGVADGSHTYRDELEEGLLHYYGTTGTLSFTLDRIEKIIAEVKASGVKAVDRETIKAYAVPADFKNYSFYTVNGYKIANGNKTEANADEIAEADLSVVLPFPDTLDFNKYNYEFKVLHLTADGVKEESFVQTAAGLRLNPESLSPFAIVWKETLKPQSSDSTQQGQQGQQGTKAPAKTPAPKTGDESSAVLWIVLFILCAGAMVVVLPRKKHNK